MKIEFVGRSVKVDAALRELAAERLAAVTRFLAGPIEVEVEMEATAGGRRRCAVDLHLRHRGGALHARAEGVDAAETLTEAAAGLESQARRARKRVTDRRRRAGRDAAERRHWPVEVLSRESLRGGDERPRVLRSTRLEIEPLTLAEAARRLEGSRNEFVVFVDRESDRVSVLYKRRDEDYGLIAPEL